VTAAAPPATAVSHARRELWIGLACVVVIVATWSGFQLVTKAGARSGLGAADLTALRFGISGILTFPLLARHGLGGVSMPRAIALMATGGLGFSLLAFAGFAYAPASHGGALMPGSLPLFTALTAATLIGERLGPVQLLGLGLIVGGVACMAAESVGPAGLGYWRGDLCFLAASFSWALFTVACRAWRITPIQATLIVCTFSMFAYLPVYLLTAAPRFIEVAPSQLLLQGVYQGVLATIVSMFVFTRAVRALGAAPTAMMTAAVPGIVTLTAAPVLGETPSPLALAGTALVTLGMLATVLTLRAAPAKP
jgi:drug/metabolite transporter (DMT)-like permease